ncbi:MAG: tRNA (adenosine(37)-N6)-threonylcarbamoyltransferase complex transferase subunit TsaD [Elusimicrobiota bacterium]
MFILGIETSCDETSASIVRGGRKIISNIVSSQTAIHKKYSGVVPELASRAHLENINWVVSAALSQAGLKMRDIGKRVAAISYTRGPGLAGSLLVGQVAAQTLSFMRGARLIDVNHIEGHLYAACLERKDLRPPYLSLVVSGGHTELIIVRDFGKYEYLGGTRDDAAGEAYDKVAKLLNLEYPGGPVIDAISKKGDPESIRFPRPLMPGTWDFSFSGLKTSVVNHVKNNGLPGPDSKALFNICASFQAAVTETLTEKTFSAAKHFKLRKVVLGGGVAANSSLRKAFLKRAAETGLDVFLPSRALCTDNAAMIACAGYYKLKKSRAGKGFSCLKAQKIEPSMKIRNWH